MSNTIIEAEIKPEITLVSPLEKKRLDLDNLKLECAPNYCVPYCRVPTCSPYCRIAPTCQPVGGGPNKFKS